MEKPHPLSELRKKYRELVNANVAHNEGLTKLDRVAIWITDHVGSMGFFILILVWTALWLGYNMLAPTVLIMAVYFKYDSDLFNASDNGRTESAG